MVNNYYLPLSVALTPDNIRSDYNPRKTIPTHNSVLRIVLKNSLEAVIYGIGKNDDLYKKNSGILISDKGKFRFDTSQECITGHEFLWNVTTWKRGSIVIVLNTDAVDFKKIFKNCFRPGLYATPNSGNTPSAILKCKKAVKEDKFAICFSASNGFESILIYANQKLTDNLYKLAKKYCKEKDYWEKEEASLGLD